MVGIGQSILSDSAVQCVSYCMTHFVYLKKTQKRHHHPQVTTIAALSQAMASIKKTYVRIICRHSKIVRPPFFFARKLFRIHTKLKPLLTVCIEKKSPHDKSTYRTVLYTQRHRERICVIFLFSPPYTRRKNATSATLREIMRRFLATSLRTLLRHRLRCLCATFCVMILIAVPKNVAISHELSYLRRFCGAYE